MMTKLYEKSFITKSALENFSQTFQGKKRSIIECGNSCTRQNATCNAIHYDQDTQVCSMWNMDSKYCNSPKFTSGFSTPDGQTEELLDMYFGSELLNTRCLCTTNINLPCVFPWKDESKTNNVLVWGCIPLYGMGYACPTFTEEDGTATGGLAWCKMGNDACTVAEGYDPLPEGTDIFDG